MNAVGMVAFSWTQLAPAPSPRATDWPPNVLYAPSDSDVQYTKQGETNRTPPHNSPIWEGSVAQLQLVSQFIVVILKHCSQAYPSLMFFF